MKNKHLILVGMMGAGKTTIAKNLAAVLKRIHIDLDDYISAYYEKSIQEIINLHTLENFRIMEEKFCHKILNSNSQPIVLSLGGGTYAHKNSFGLAKDHLIIFLECSLETLYNRLNCEVELSKRPLLNALDPSRLKTSLLKILTSRQSLYQQAELKINCDHLDLEEITQEICKHL